jgi:hypothetical protein
MVLEFGRPVRGLSPLPILTGHPTQTGDVAFVFGYGLSNGPFPQTLEALVDNLQIGAIQVDGFEPGVFYSDIADPVSAGKESLLCSGDSGGPVMKFSTAFDAAFLIGVNSVGNSSDSPDDRCEIGPSGAFSGFVDLQSKDSRRFLKRFKGIRFVRSADID